MGNEQGCNERIETPESTSPTTGPVAWVSKQVKKKQTRNRLLHMLRRSERLMWMEVAVSKEAGAEYPVCSAPQCAQARVLTSPQQPPRNSQGSCFFQDCMFVYGGRSPEGRLNDLWVFRCETRCVRSRLLLCVVHLALLTSLRLDCGVVWNAMTIHWAQSFAADV